MKKNNTILPIQHGGGGEGKELVVLDLMLICSTVRAFQEHFDHQRTSLILLTTECEICIIDTVTIDELHIPYPTYHKCWQNFA